MTDFHIANTNNYYEERHVGQAFIFYTYSKSTGSDNLLCRSCRLWNHFLISEMVNTDDVSNTKNPISKSLHEMKEKKTFSLCSFSFKSLSSVQFVYTKMVQSEEEEKIIIDIIFFLVFKRYVYLVPFQAG